MRVGVELEGPHKGKRTLVLLTVEHMTTEVVLPIVRDKGIEHLWLERQPGERYDWQAVRNLRARTSLPMTLLMACDDDVPVFSLRCQLSLVLRVPAACSRAARVASHLQVLSGTGPFRGCELTVVSLREFNPEEYEKDEVWIP